MFDPATYRAELEKADAVVHTMGVIFGDEKYKQLVNGEFSVDKVCGLAEEVKKAAWSRFVGGAADEHPNPLKRSPVGQAGGAAQDSSPFQRLNRESAVTLARAFSETSSAAAAADAGAGAGAATPIRKPFVYISAEDHNIFAPSEYIESKRLAEADLALIPNLRTVFLRPGFMAPPASPTPTVRDTIGSLLKAKYAVASTLGVEKQTGSWPVLDVETVAKAVVESVGDASLQGPVGLMALDRYARDL